MREGNCECALYPMQIVCGFLSHARSAHGPYSSRSMALVPAVLFQGMEAEMAPAIQGGMCWGAWAPRRGVRGAESQSPLCLTEANLARSSSQGQHSQAPLPRLPSAPASPPCSPPALPRMFCPQIPPHFRSCENLLMLHLLLEMPSFLSFSNPVSPVRNSTRKPPIWFEALAVSLPTVPLNLM